MDDKLALRMSQAGMRFIAQMTIYNGGSEDRLRQFISESYHPDLLESQPLDERLAEFQARLGTVGRLKVRQVLGSGKYHVVVLLEAEKADGFFLSELKVEEDYPHLIRDFNHSAMS